MELTERQRVRLQQIAKHAAHLRKVPNEVRWRYFFEFQDVTYRRYIQGFRDRYPELSDEEITELIKQETLRRHGKRLQ